MSLDQIELIAHPSLSFGVLNQVLQQKHNWISTQWNKLRVQYETAEPYPSCVYLSGLPMPVLVQVGDKNEAVVNDQGMYVIALSLEDKVSICQSVIQCLQSEAKHRFTERAAVFAAQATVWYASLRVSSARTHWGSCSASGNIRINWRLVQAPNFVLDYVIAHELAHLLHANHSKQFWAETARLYPAWQRARTWLRSHGHTLFILG